jgi:hypothetical protein
VSPLQSKAYTLVAFKQLSPTSQFGLVDVFGASIMRINQIQSDAYFGIPPKEDIAYLSRNKCAKDSNSYCEDGYSFDNML